MLHRLPAQLLLILFPFAMQAQDWVSKMQDTSVNFYDVQTSFNKYWKKEEHKEKFRSFFSFTKRTEAEENEGFTMYKRWESYMEPRVYPSGDRRLMRNAARIHERLITDPAYRSSLMAAGNWQPLGAFSVPTGGGGAGRLNCVRFHPTNPNIIYVGSPGGGLWKTTNGGSTWSTATDQLPSLGVSDIAIDPVTTNVMYIGTGDCDASDTYGVGVLKSTDGGLTWNITGLSYAIMQGRNVNRVMISPADHNIIFAASTAGFFRSADAGATWVRVSSVNIRDMEFKPGDPSVIYICSGTTFYKSTNSGVSFTSLSTGLPAGVTVSRIAMAVTAANPAYIYLLYADAGTSAFKALYRSTDSGNSFSLMSDYPNLLGYDPAGMDSGGQGWYTLSIAASPFDADQIVVGGVNIWGSGDGGGSWSILAHWYGAGGLPYVHADIHDLIYQPVTGKIFAACDGGIFSTADGGFSWNDISSGLQIGELYRLGNSVTNPSLVMSGWQDNGCNLYSGGSWSRPLGGDGMETFIDWSNPAYVYGESQNGGLARSSNGGTSFTDITSGITETGSWITPWQQDPQSSQTLYAGFENVWKSTNRGNTWYQISSFNAQVTSLCVAPSNPLYIYASNGVKIYRTTDGGGTWTTLSPAFSGTNQITYLAVSTSDPQKIWVTLSGYTATNKVYRSSDAGATWTNLSAGLPNLPVNCVVNQSGTSDGIYVGTDVGVYYTDNILGVWKPYMNGLPDVTVDELEIQYSSGKLRAATYGRGLWETSVYDPASTKPFANFVADSLAGCPGLTVQFTDSTANNPTSWQWSFPGGTPSTSTLQNPVVIYNVPGTYNNVKLVATNSSGVDSVTKFSYIAISPHTTPIITSAGNDTLCGSTSMFMSATTGQSYSWHPFNQTNYIIGVYAANTYSVTVTDIFGCASTSLPVQVYSFPAPAAPVITVNQDTLFSDYSSGNQWYYNGVAIAGATDSIYLMTNPGNYYDVVRIDSSGCTAQSNMITGVPEMNMAGIVFSLYPNPADDFSTLSFAGNANKVIIKLLDPTGRIVREITQASVNGQTEIKLDVHELSAGLYMLSLSTEKGSVIRKLIVR